MSSSRATATGPRARASSRPAPLRGRTIVITGASSGIGEATARACAAAGMNLVLNARRIDRLQKLAAEIESAGAAVELMAGDVSAPDTSAALLAAAAARFGGFDAVFANAGYGLTLPAVDVTMQDLRDIFEVNFFAAVELVQQAACRLVEAKRPGHLLMCSSCLAKFTLPSHSAYSATKAAQNHVCRAMRVELEPHGIHVSSVHPITTATEFFAVATGASGRGRDREDHRAVPDHSPKLFVQTPDRVARAVVRCLERPRPEVWTSFTVRAVAAFMTLSPGFTDMVLRRVARKDGR